MLQSIILVRQRETDYNKERRMQGWLDVPLNKTGREQAKAIALKLRGIKYDAVYSSDLIRAYETAKIIVKSLKHKINTTGALRERDMGIFAGWAWESERDEIKDMLWAEFQASRDSEDLHWNKHQGESQHQMSTRVSDFMRSLHALHAKQSVVIVTHSGTINRILEQYKLKQSIEGFRMIRNGAVLILNKSAEGYTLEEM